MHISVIKRIIRMIPRKPIADRCNTNIFYSCPTCDIYLTDFNSHPYYEKMTPAYCDVCGQKINWNRAIVRR